jgi:diguanylate cyclase (GGDEF)-like protein
VRAFALRSRSLALRAPLPLNKPCVTHPPVSLYATANHEAPEGAFARDPATGLWAMRAFSRKVAEMVEQDSAGAVAGLLIVEVGGMPQLFQMHGQTALDQAMALLVKRLSPAYGTKDIVCRFGQSQFALFLPDLDHPGKALFAASAITSALDEPIEAGGRQLFASARIGVAIFPHDAQDGSNLIRNACIALAEAGRSGSASYLHYTDGMRAALHERLSLEDELRIAAREGQFTLEYQPKVAIHDGYPLGGEALLRWHHPTRGTIPPSRFIPAAEETGLIVPIGEWVLRHAVDQVRRWLDAGLPPMQISVNVSERQFRWGNLPALIDVLLTESRIPAHLLQLEITETILPDDLQGALQQMRWIADRGVALAMDDFGTGYSSLSYLRELPLDCLKIDRQFIMVMERDPNTRHIVEAIVAMAKAMNLKAVAEGVETEAQWSMLRRLGAEEGQGYLFARPMPPDAFAAFIRKAWQGSPVGRTP